MEKKIEVKNLDKTFYLFNKDYKILEWLVTGKGCQKERKVLKNISFSIDDGEIVGLIGVNGAGKSTLMKLIAGITYPTSGEVTVRGRVGSLINLSAGFNHLLERCRFDNAHLDTGCFSFCLRKDDFITVRFGRLVMSIGRFMVVFSATFAFMRMIGTLCLVIMSFRGMIVFIVCVCDGTIITGTQHE